MGQPLYGPFNSQTGVGSGALLLIPQAYTNMKNSVHSCTVKSESVCQILALHNLELATATSLEVFDSSARMCYALMLIISARRALKTCTWSWTCTILMHARALPSVARRYRSSQGLPVGVKPKRSKLPGLRVARARARGGGGGDGVGGVKA